MDLRFDSFKRASLLYSTSHESDSKPFTMSKKKKKTTKEHNSHKHVTVLTIQNVRPKIIIRCTHVKAVDHIPQKCQRGLGSFSYRKLFQRERQKSVVALWTYSGRSRQVVFSIEKRVLNNKDLWINNSKSLICCILHVLFSFDTLSATHLA